jgi:diaminopimelate epimerase
MRIAFTKMHGAGNDVIVFDSPAGAALPTAGQFRALGDRRTGIGFDQAMVLAPPRQEGTQVYYRIFNRDGGEVEQCGNGARCVAALLRQRGAAAEFTMDSTGGLIGARVLGPKLVAINMGVPDFRPAALPFLTAMPAATYQLQAGGETVEFGAVSMGNPHAVLVVPDVDNASVDRLGPAIEHHSRFPRRTNVGFMQIEDRGHIRLRVHERGVGETRACGTGACAAVAVGRRHGLLDAEVEVSLQGGKVWISWPGGAEHLWMTGPAARVFSGTVEI